MIIPPTVGVVIMKLSELGCSVRRARKERGITQKALASACGLSRATVNAFESGKMEELGFSRVNSLCDLLGLKISVEPSPQVQPPIPAFSKLLVQLGKRYIWWALPGIEPDEDRIIAQVMDIATFDDVRAMEAEVGEARMRQALNNARPGWFSPKSWTFWHLVLGLAKLDGIPPQPRRENDLQSKLQDDPDAYVVLATAPGGGDTVKISFFGEISFGRIGVPELSSDGVLLAASLRDLMATKLKVLFDRVEPKDYIDIAEMIKRGLSLKAGICDALAMFPDFSPMYCLKTLCFFDLKELANLDGKCKTILVKAARATAKETGFLPAKKHSLSLVLPQQDLRAKLALIPVSVATTRRIPGNRPSKK